MSERPYNVSLRGGWTATVFMQWDFPSRVIDQWQGILASYGAMRVFIGPAWFESWWNAFGAGRELFVVVLEKEGKVQAVFPCCITCDSGGETVSSLTNDHTCHYDFSIHPAVRHEAAAVFLEFLGSVKPGAGVSLEYVPVAGSNGEVFFEELQRAKVPSHRYGQPWDPRLEVTGEWEAFRKTLPGRLRNIVRKSRKRAEAQGKLSFEAIGKSGHLDALLDAFFEVEHNNWKGRNGTAIRCNADTERFYRELARRAMQSGRLLLFLLRLGDAPIAASFCLYDEGTVFLLKSGYHEGYEYFTPGNLLYFEKFRYLFESPHITRCNFTGPCEPWKREWTTQTGEYGWIRAFPKSLKGWGDYMLRYGWKNQIRGIGSRFRSATPKAGYGPASS